MKANMGANDRIIRVVAGVVMLLFGFITHSWWGAVGVVPLLTAAIGFCPLYTVLGISTCGGCDADQKPGKSASRLS